MPPVVTLCAGDSITMGSTAFLGGWRRPLNNLAPNLAMVGPYCVDGTYGPMVGHHAGISGGTTANLISTILPMVDVTYFPSLVIMMIGTNNVGAGYEQSASTAIANVVSCAESFLAKTSVTKVLVCNIPPRASNNTYYQPAADFRAGLQAAVAQASAGIYYCDPCATLVNPGVHFSDSLHPSEAGYAVIAPGILTGLIAAGVQTQPERTSLSRTNGYAPGSRR